MRLFKSLFQASFRYNFKGYNGFCQNNQIFLNRFLKIHSSPSYFYSRSQFSEIQFKEMIELNKQKSLDSNQLFIQFNERLKDIDDELLVNRFCRYYGDKFQQRTDTEKALQVYSTAFELCKERFQSNQFQRQAFFKSHMILLYYEQGNMHEVNRLSSELYTLYVMSKEQLDPQSKFKFIRHLAHVMNRVNRLDLSEKYLEGSISLIQTVKTLEYTKTDLYEIFYFHFGINFVKGNYQEAAEYGVQAYEIVKGDLTYKPQYLLTGIYIAFNQLKLQEQCNIIKQELSNYPKLYEEKIEDLTVANFYPFRVVSNPKKQSTDQQINQNESNQDNNKSSQNSDSDAIWNDKDNNDQWYLYDNRQKEGIEYYQEIVKKLDPVRDIEKLINIQDRIALLYCEMKDYNKGIELSLDSHQKILKLRNNILVRDDITIQNLTFLKQFYLHNRDFTKAVEWGQKWHSYCLKYNLFDTEDLITIENLFSHMLALQQIGKQAEALEYCKFIKYHLERFQNKTHMNKINLKMQEILFLLERPEEGIKQAKVVLENHEYDKFDSHEKEIFYVMLIKCLDFCIKTKDVDQLLEFWKQYVKVRKDFEQEEDHLPFRIKILFDISSYFVKEKKFLEAEDILQDTLNLLKKKPSLFPTQINILIVQINILVNLKKYEEAEEYINLIEKAIPEYFIDNSTKVFLEIYLLIFSSRIQFQRKQYTKALETIEKQLNLESETTLQITKLQRNILKTMLNEEVHKSKAASLIAQFKINLDDLN